MDIANLSYGVEPKSDVVEIDGKKYRKVDTNCYLENGDLILHDNLIHTFVGYHIGYSVLAKQDGSFVSSNFNFHFKLEEIKVKVWHYAIYKNSFGKLCHSNLYESKEPVEANYPDALEYRTFEEQL